jgi:glyoxylase-like metal-dependent hydrolase (beta-lactamase superfamily II)
MGSLCSMDWYRQESLGDGVTLIWESAIKPFYRCNIWHVRGRDGDLLLDSGMGIHPLRQAVSLLAERPLLAVASHTHIDHIGAHHEFCDCAVHAAEADILRRPDRRNTIADVYLTDEMFEAAAPPGYSSATYIVSGAEPTRLLAGGDVIDLGDRAFEVLHLPGHSPGSIALWEEKSGTLFSGDTVYDGPLIDDFYHSRIDAYLTSMERLRRLPVEVVHAGHFGSFGRTRLHQLIDDYVAGKRAAGCPAGR